MKKYSVLFVFLFSWLLVSAEEGMWRMDQLQQLDLLKAGIEMTADELYNESKPSLKDAIVNLGGGTAELVSSQGLILTNHHVAFGALQRAASQRNSHQMIELGFNALTMAEEIPAPGYTARILLSTRDVTAEFAAFKKISNLEKRSRLIDEKSKMLVDKAQQGRSDLEAKVTDVFYGQKYLLHVYKKYQDVRLVFVPPLAIGNFGDDIDNWMWPRHCGDFSFMRIYTAADGSGAEFSENNIPLKPKYWLKIAKTPLKEGDMTFIMGYPGNTQRYRSYPCTDYSFNLLMPESVKSFQETLAIMESLAAQSEEAKVRLAGMIARLSNPLKNYQGQLEMAKKTNLLETKKQQEQELMAFIKADPSLNKKYGTVFEKLTKRFDQDRLNWKKIALVTQLKRASGEISGIATMVYASVKEREKPKKTRDPFFSEEELSKEITKLKFRYLSFYEAADKALLKRVFQLINELSAEKSLAAVRNLMAGYDSPDSYINELFAKTQLKDSKFAEQLFSKTSAELDKMADPMIVLARTLYPFFEEMRRYDEKKKAELDDYRFQYTQALAEWKKCPLYTDADRTLRLTFGAVSGYEARDAVYFNPFSTLAGVIEKDSGVVPFNVPEKLKELFAAKDYGVWLDKTLNDVPVNFLSACDITGGNSGSPVLNSKGELIGCVFDGNWEAITSDWQYYPLKQRSITADIRYILFVLDKFANARNILKELE
jgi:hypothetical protein